MFVQSINNYQNSVNFNKQYTKPSINFTSLKPNKPDTFERVNFGNKAPLSPEQLKQISDLKVLTHHIYEYKKGIRPLFLETLSSKYKDAVKEKLEKNKIDYVIHDFNKKTINIYFGKKNCVEVVRTLNPKLSDHTPQEDFILGILLGYDRVKQCARYMRIKNGDLKIGKHVG